MRRQVLPALVLAVLVAAVVVAPAGAATLASARLVSCGAATSANAGRAAFEGDMRAIPGTERMQMRFLLYARTAGSRWRRVSAPGFGTWLTSDPGVQRYVYTKRIRDLVAPGAYRARVAFRWLGPSGTMLLRDVHRTPICRVPDPRPNLRLESLLVEPGSSAATRSYVLSVANAGREASGPFDVAVWGDGWRRVARVEQDVRPGESVRLSVEAPACAPGALVHARADFSDAIDERSEADNGRAVECPPVA